MSSKIPPLYKMNATGNLFLIADLRDSYSDQSWKNFFSHFQISREKMVSLLCQHPSGFSADGLLFLETSEDKNVDFQWDFYNSDGSPAEMCGNAARCVAYLAYAKNKNKTQYTFKTLAGNVRVRFATQKKIEVDMPAIQTNNWGSFFSHDGEKFKFDFLNTGVPHAVVAWPSFEASLFSLSDKLKKMARALRHHSPLGREGANVTLYQLSSLSKIEASRFKNSSPIVIEALTYERGVENFTSACGTGAVAAAWACHHHLVHREKYKSVVVKMPGGLLLVDFSSPCPILTGSAHLLGKIKLSRYFFNFNNY